MARRLIALLDIGQSQATFDPDFLTTQTEQAIDFITIAPLDAYEPELLVEKFKPLPDDLPISSMTKHGERILVSKSYLVPELRRGVQEAADRKFDAVLITCTGAFDLGDVAVPIILPGDVLRRQVQLHRNEIKSVAVIVPVDEQQIPLTGRWSEQLPGSRIKAFTLSPQSSVKECDALAVKLAIENFDTVVMDCFGFSVAQHKTFEYHIRSVYSAKDTAIKLISSM